MKINRRLALIAVLTFFVFLPVSVSAKDEWIRVQSKNFNLVGNASEKEIRKVATRLEQFRETFRQIFSRLNLVTPIQTNVVVFKNNSAYKPFKPKRADGKTDDFIAGFFQPGEDVNYITLSTERDDAQTFEVIFHEYVHFLVNTNIGKSKVPPWFNEGLAEYYSTFAIDDDQKVKLGIFKQNNINLLAQRKLIPLDKLFAVSNYGLLQLDPNTRGVFYAESWALIHYLIQNGKNEGLGKFLQLLMKDTPPAQAFADSFQMNYEQMEKELTKYVAQDSYKYITVTLKEKLTFENQMQTFPLSEAEADAYLGDLLFHNNRADDAEILLQKSIALDANQSTAYTTLGMIRFRQGKYDEARNYLEKAISDSQKNALALYYYAYALSRADENGAGFSGKLSPEKSAKMRSALKQSIALNPSFAPDYDLLAFVSLASGENLDEAIAMLRKALTIQPGNQRSTLRIAEIYLRQEKFDEAKAIAEKIAQTADDPEIKSRAENLRFSIQQFQENRARYGEALKRREGSSPALARRDGATVEKNLSPEEEAKLEREDKMIALNEAVRKPEAGEKQIVGHITKIVCSAEKVVYTVKTGTETVTLYSKDFQTLSLVALSKGSESVEFGCNANTANLNTVLTFKKADNPKSGAKGELTAIDFVPDDFRFVEPRKN
ncbi:MAG: tetratricopeptide repeat protein [Pyrinomonadaceae bacterium]